MNTKKTLRAVLFSFLLFAGCAYPNLRFKNINDFTVNDKRGIGGTDDIRTFIKPEETEKLINALNLKDKSEEEKVQAIFNYVCGLKIIDENKDYWQYPKETLGKGGGDCEDKVFLLVSALKETGIKDVYGVKGRYLGGGHFWAEYKDEILDPVRKGCVRIKKEKAFGYIPFFKFDNINIYISEKTGG